MANDPIEQDHPERVHRRQYDEDQECVQRVPQDEGAHQEQCHDVPQSAEGARGDGCQNTGD